MTSKMVGEFKSLIIRNRSCTKFEGSLLSVIRKPKTFSPPALTFALLSFALILTFFPFFDKEGVKELERKELS